MEKTSLKDLKILTFFDVLLASINFLLSKVNMIEYRKLIQIVEAVTFVIALRRVLLFLDMF